MVKFLDLQAVNDSFEPQLSDSVIRTIRSGWYLQGNEVKEFESEYSNYIGTKHCIGVANGLDALRLILKAEIILGKLKEGDEIIVPANTYIATILAITDNKLKPIFVEPDLFTYNINSSLIESKISSKTKGIMIVHLYGQNAMNEEILRLIEKYKLLLFEDNAQAAGAYFRSKRTGALGNAAGHSFYPGKNLGALGDGGAVTTNDDELAYIVRTLANYGSNKKYINSLQGVNSRLDEIQAAALRVKLVRLDLDNQRRREIANMYLSNIDTGNIELPICENVLQNKSHVWHLFVIRTGDRDILQSKLNEVGVQTLIHYPIPPHQQDAYKQYRSISLPITELIHNQVLSLPISQVMDNESVEMVIENVFNVYK